MRFLHKHITAQVTNKDKGVRLKNATSRQDACLVKHCCALYFCLGSFKGPVSLWAQTQEYLCGHTLLCSSLFEMCQHSRASPRHTSEKREREKGSGGGSTAGTEASKLDALDSNQKQRQLAKESVSLTAETPSNLQARLPNRQLELLHPRLGSWCPFCLRPSPGPPCAALPGRLVPVGIQ